MIKSRDSDENEGNVHLKVMIRRMMVMIDSVAVNMQFMPTTATVVTKLQERFRSRESRSNTTTTAFANTTAAVTTTTTTIIVIIIIISSSSSLTMD